MCCAYLIDIAVVIDLRVWQSIKTSSNYLFYYFRFVAAYFRFYCWFCSAFTATRHRSPAANHGSLFIVSKKAIWSAGDQQRPAPPRMLCLLPPQLLLLLLILFSRLFLLLSVAQGKLKQGVCCCCWYPPLALALQFYNDSNSNHNNAPNNSDNNRVREWTRHLPNGLRLLCWLQHWSDTRAAHTRGGGRG